MSFHAFYHAYNGGGRGSLSFYPRALDLCALALLTTCLAYCFGALGFMRFMLLSLASKVSKVTMLFVSLVLLCSPLALRTASVLWDSCVLCFCP